MKLGPLWNSLGIRLADALADALPLPLDLDVVLVRVRGRGFAGGFRLERTPAPWEATAALPPLEAPEDVWDVVGELVVLEGNEVSFGSPLLDRRRLVRAIRAYLEDPDAAEVEAFRPRAPRETKRIRRV